MLKRMLLGLTMLTLSAQSLLPMTKYIWGQVEKPKKEVEYEDREWSEVKNDLKTYMAAYSQEEKTINNQLIQEVVRYFVYRQDDEALEWALEQAWNGCLPILAELENYFYALYQEKELSPEYLNSCLELMTLRLHLHFEEAFVYLAASDDQYFTQFYSNIIKNLLKEYKVRWGRYLAEAELLDVSYQDVLSKVLSHRYIKEVVGKFDALRCDSVMTLEQTNLFLFKQPASTNWSTLKTKIGGSGNRRNHQQRVSELMKKFNSWDQLLANEIVFSLKK